MNTSRRLAAAVILCGLGVGACGTDASHNPVGADARLASFTQGRPLFVEPGALLPDLTIDEERIASSLILKSEMFKPTSCALVEQCVNAAGRRKLLRFDVVTPNIGPVDLTLGSPSNSSLFQYSACHSHYHFSGYAQYDLIAPGGTVVLAGRKQAFCLEDFTPSSSSAGRPRYTCQNQGISTGWQDEYDRSLDCQWLDVTDIEPGKYQIRVSINPLGLLQESNLNNNVATVPLVILKEGGLLLPGRR